MGRLEKRRKVLTLGLSSCLALDLACLELLRCLGVRFMSLWLSVAVLCVGLPGWWSCPSL